MSRPRHHDSIRRGIRLEPGIVDEAGEVSPELPPQWRVTLACGHEGATWGEPHVGQYVSCWAAVINGGGSRQDSCQAQREVTSVRPAP